MIRAIHSFNHGAGLVRVWPTESPDQFSVTVGKEQIGTITGKAGSYTFPGCRIAFRRLSVAAADMADGLKNNGSPKPTI